MRTARENNFYFLFYMFFMLKIVIRIDVRVRDEGVEKNWEQFHTVILGLKYVWYMALLLPAVQIEIGKHHRIPRIFLPTGPSRNTKNRFHALGNNESLV